MKFTPPFRPLVIISFVVFTACGVLSASPSPSYSQHDENLNSPSRSNFNVLEKQLTELKDIPEESSWRFHPTPYSTKAGQPELTNEDLEEELTEVRPLDIPLQILEVDDDGENLHYVTSSPRTLDRPYNALEETYPHHDGHDRDENSDHSGDSSTTPSTNNEEDSDDDSDDDDDDNDADGDDYSAGEEDEDDKDDGTDSEGDDDDDGTAENIEKNNGNQGKIVGDHEPPNAKKPTTEQHSREDQRLPPTPSGETVDDHVGTLAMSNGGVETTSRGPATLMGDLEKFLGLTVLPSEKPMDHKEADLDSGTRLEQVRELEKKANIPQKLVDAVSPKADESLLELMVKIAEDPAEWHRVHLQLQQLDEDLTASRNSIEKVQAWEDAEDASILPELHPQKSLLTSMLNISEDDVQVMDSIPNQKKHKGPLQEEQQRVATMDDEIDGDPSLIRSNISKANAQRPISEQEEVEMVANIDDDHEKAKRRYNDDNLNSPQKAISLTTNEWEGKKKTQKQKSKNKENEGYKILKGESDERRNLLEQAGVLTPLKPTSKPISGKTHSKDKTKISNNFKGNSKNGFKTTPHKGNSGTKNKSNKLKSQKGKEPTTTKAPSIITHNPKSPPVYEPVLATHIANESSSHKNGSRNSGISFLRKHLGTLSSSKGGESKWQKVANKLKVDKQMDGNSSTSDQDIHGKGIRPLIMKLSRYIPARNNTPPWLAINEQNYRMPSKEERSEPKTSYYSDVTSYDQPRDEWPNFSLDSMKHGGNTNKQWSDLSNFVNLEQNQKPNSKTTYESSSNDVINKWPAFPPEFAGEKDNNIDLNTWPNFSNYHYDKAFSNRLNSAWSEKEVGNHRPGVSRQWPHFAYHRVTSSPQVLAQQRARHRNAYVAVSVVAPPEKAKPLHKATTSATGNTSSDNIGINKSESRSSKPLEDKMDMLLTMRSEQKTSDPLEEELVDTAASTSRANLPWSHARHLDRIQEQLKTLSAMEEKLRYHWLEKERLRQILRDGGKTGSGLYREPRDANRQDVMIGSPATRISPSLSEPEGSLNAP